MVVEKHVQWSPLLEEGPREMTAEIFKITNVIPLGLTSRGEEKKSILV